MDLLTSLVGRDVVLSEDGYIKLGGYSLRIADNLAGIGLHVRTRVTLAEMNAGKTLLPALTNVAYRLHDMSVVAIGGSATATVATGAAVYGTKAGSATALYTALLAALTENAVCQVNTADTSVASGGGLFTSNDPGTAITCKAVSAGDFDLATATHFDVVFSYSVEVG